MINNKIDKGIETLNKSLCRHIENINRDDRGIVAQDILSDLRHFIEHIMLKIYSTSINSDLEIEYKNICSGINYVKSQGSLNFLKKFHDLLQIVISHYKPLEENAERLMLKYYEYLFKVREYLKLNYNMEVLHNLEKFPLDIDLTLKEYYEKISLEIEKYSLKKIESGEKYYIQKIKPFFVNTKIYYEITFTLANDFSNKTDRIIAFSKIPIIDNYASLLNLEKTMINIVGKDMPILIINGWKISIRNCEFKNFFKIIKGYSQEIGYSVTNSLCTFMTEQRINLLDFINMEQFKYEKTKDFLASKAKNLNFFNVLDIARKIIINKNNGANILRYLLFTMNNTIIKKQFNNSSNINLSGLYIDNKAIPFDKIPFNFSPIGHNPPLEILYDCFDFEEHQPALLARYIRNKTEIEGHLFTSLKELNNFENPKDLIDKYNSILWYYHKPQNELRIDKEQIFIYKYVEDCRKIIEQLKILSKEGVQNYTNSVKEWLNTQNNGVDCEEKKEFLSSMFEKSKVGIIYGAAGTGKSTLINHISLFFSDKKKLFLAQTNPAVDNLKRRINISNSVFLTITKFLKTRRIDTEYDILVIDECSTVNNTDMREILKKAKFTLLILVGDIYQIESIRFGNWFTIAKNFIPSSSIFELTTPYRTKNQGLLNLWKRVREMDDSILELITRQNFSTTLDDSIFENTEKDEVILCLNYDGLYGINNINRFLQESNPSKAIIWGILQFKVGDPILFNDSERFNPIIYNNMKGRILGIDILDAGKVTENIQFDIELDKNINGIDAQGMNFELLNKNEYNSNNSVIRFCVFKNEYENFDEDTYDINTIIPFQISYAISIHKAQGLEYNSVKIVIANEVDELITHSIFYTAITRAKSKLKIYWTPEVEHKILSTLKPRSNSKDISLLYKVTL